MATAFHDHYASVGWQDASHGKRRIVDLALKLRRWKIDQPSHGKTGAANPDSAHALKLRIDEADRQLAAMPERRNRTPEQNRTVAELHERKKVWQRQLAGG